MKKDTLQPHKLYGNISVFSPDGYKMFYCNMKKANWYVAKGLAKFIDNENKSLQLLFQPKGLGLSDQQNFLEEQENKCVVCGNKTDLRKVHLVPRAYLAILSPQEKGHKFYHLIMLCVGCHNIYDKVCGSFIKKISEKYDAPLMGRDSYFDRESLKIRKAAWALLYADKMPQDARNIRYNQVVSYLGRNPSQEDLENLSKRNSIVKSKNYKSHYELVMQKVHNKEEIFSLWRRNFVQTMNPRFLPKHYQYLNQVPVWSVNE